MVVSKGCLSNFWKKLGKNIIVPPPHFLGGEKSIAVPPQLLDLTNRASTIQDSCLRVWIIMMMAGGVGLVLQRLFNHAIACLLCINVD